MYSQVPPGFKKIHTYKNNSYELENSYPQIQPDVQDINSIDPNNLNSLKTSNYLKNIYLNNSQQVIQTSSAYENINPNNVNLIQAPPGFENINSINLNNMNSLQTASDFKSTDQNKDYDFYLIQDIEKILNYDSQDENNSNDLFSSVKNINIDLSDSSDDEIESVLSEENFEGTMYDSKFVDIIKYYKDFDISIKNSLDLYFINIKNKKYELNSLEELYKFHEEFKVLYERKNYLKSNKNTNRKKKESYNRRVNDFTNKYEIFKIELDEILKFTLNDSSKKSDYSKSSDINFTDDIKIAIDNNIKYCTEELDKYNNDFEESFTNNKHKNINILYYKYSELNNIFINFNDIYKRYKEYIDYYNIKNNYIDKYNFINKEFNYLMLVKLVFEFLHFDKYFLDKDKNYNLVGFFDLFNETAGITKNIIEINNQYNDMYDKLNNLYNKYQYFKDDNFLKEEILKCNIRYKYFKKPNLSNKNDIINFINNILNFFLKNNNSIEIIKEIKKNYLDIIYSLPNEYFQKKKNDFELSDLTFIKESYENTFKKYGISLKQHMSVLTLNYQHNKCFK